MTNLKRLNGFVRSELVKSPGRRAPKMNATKMLEWAHSTLYYMRKGDYAKARDVLERYLSKLNDRIFLFMDGKPCNIESQQEHFYDPKDKERYGTVSAAPWNAGYRFFGAPTKCISSATSRKSVSSFNWKLFGRLGNSHSKVDQLILKPEYINLSFWSLKDGETHILDHQEYRDAYVIVKPEEIYRHIPIRKGGRLVFYCDEAPCEENAHLWGELYAIRMRYLQDRSDLLRIDELTGAEYRLTQTSLDATGTGLYAFKVRL